MSLLKFASDLRFAILLSLLTLTFAHSRVDAQSAKGILSGTVSDSAGAALKGAQLKLLPIGLTTTSDEVGGFAFPELAAGEYTLHVSYVGFKPFDLKVQVTSGQSPRLEVKLEVNSANEEILVTAERIHGEADAINETRTADNILQVLPAEVIVSLPNANVADAIGRLPSVSLYRIEGEGVYIQVRGTEPRLTNVTVDGVTLPAPEPTVRQVRLDVVPSELVSAVEINKCGGPGCSDSFRRFLSGRSVLRFRLPEVLAGG
jgi:hypothetical protein